MIEMVDGVKYSMFLSIRNKYYKQGKTQCVATWAQKTGLSSQTIKWRINNGWSVEKVLSTPVRKRK